MAAGKILLPLILIAGGCVLPPAPSDPYVPPDDGVTIVVYRLKQFSGGGQNLYIEVDGMRAGKVKNGGELTLLVTPGQHEIAAHHWTSGATAPVIYKGQAGLPIIHKFTDGPYYIRWKQHGLLPKPDPDAGFQLIEKMEDGDRRP